MPKSKSSTGIKKTAKKAVNTVAPQKTAKKFGRPFIEITQEKLDKIFAYLEQGESFRAACEKVGLDRMTTLNRINANTELNSHYAQCRQKGLEYKVDTIYETIKNEPDVQRARLYVDTLKWHISKVLPKLYGDKLQVSADVKADVKASVSGDFVALFLNKFKGGDKC